MTTLIQDIRYGLRTLAKNPGFAAVAIITLALGIGANTAIFSVVNAVVLHPLPIHDPGRVVAVHERYTQLGLSSIGVSGPDFEDIGRRKDVFARTAVITGANFDLAGSGRPEHLTGLLVSGGFFPLLGVEPLIGRWFLSSEDQPGASHVAMISESLWRSAFGSNPNLPGHSITLNGQSYTVAGVMPDAFGRPSLNADVWAPLALTREQLDPVKERGHQWLYMLARLQPGVTLARAQAALDSVTSQFDREYPNEFPPKVGFGITAVPLKTDVLGDTGGYLFVLLAAVAFVLLIACANVASLMLGRASSRSKEIAVRTALGASRARIIRQVLTESGLLALGGGALGLWIGVWGVDGLKAIGPKNFPRLSQAGMDGRVLLFTAAVALIAAILFGLTPAMRASETDLHEALKEGGRAGSGGAARQRLRSLLVVSEVSLTFVLLAGGVLMVKSLVRLLDVDPGFDPHNVLTMRISLPPSRYSNPAQIADFYQAVLKRTAALPGVEATGGVNALPFSGRTNSGSFRIEGRPFTTGVILPHADARDATPGFFRALRIPMRQGRTFTNGDTATAPKVAIVDDVLTREYWPKESPIGQRVMFPLGSTGNGGTWYRVVGIVGNVRNRGFSAPRKGVLYFPEAQRAFPDLSLVIRTASRPAEMANAVRAAIAGVDREQPVYDVKTMDEYVSDSVSDHRLDVFLLGIFGLLALTLAAVGIYGVISYDVTQRTREIGIRMALGARQGDVLRLILRKGATLALIGVGIGICVAVGVMRLMTALLYGVKPADPETLIAVSVVLLAVALLACFIPARRAMNVDPIEALR
ncbi:MAG: ABC transporter permease, partial [Terriglobia bacterium]